MVAAEAILEPKLVGDIVGEFFVPAYQRGYRWGKDEVTKLLDDIWESRGKPYYLQPVVVKRQGPQWELIDGQQRLTTLFLLFQYMKREGLLRSGAGYSLRYETRADSAAYLESIDPALSQKNIDFFHIFQAYQCIADWFAGHGHRLEHAAKQVHGALFDHVQVIWYEAPEDVDSNTIFRRLNVGRIPLTDAELVKAMLLSRIRKEPDIAYRAHEIAAQWDAFERDLRDAELWAFITGKTSIDSTHIDLLLDILAGGPTGRDRPRFHTFDVLRERIAVDPLGFWDEVVALHAVVTGWYADRDLFHRIGYLVAQRVTDVRALLAQAQGRTRSAFADVLRGLIRDTLALTPSELRDLTYSTDKIKAGRVLLLLNVETIRQRSHSVERYSFSEQAAGSWSLEHVHAQSAEGIGRSKDLWAAWLSLHLRALRAMDGIDSASRERLIARTEAVLGTSDIKETDFQDLEHQFTSALSLQGDGGDDSVHSISNLALLPGDVNSVLSNSVFAVKRAAMLEMDRLGAYIPICTRYVFLKYYSPAEEHQMHFWSANDREHYLEAMVKVLRDYLREEPGATS